MSGAQIADDVAVGDEPVLADLGALRAGFAGVEGSGDARQRDVVGEQPGEPQGLVVGQGVHRVQDDRLHPGDPGPLGALDVVEDRVEKCLGLARAGPGGHQSRLRARSFGGQAVAAQPGERGGLMPVRGGAFVPFQRIAPAVLSRPERQPQPHIRAAEHSEPGILQEVVEDAPGIRVGEREGGAEVVEQAALDRVGLRQG